MGGAGDQQESKAARIRALAARGVPRREIATLVGVSPNHVDSSLSRDRAEGRIPARPRQGSICKVAVAPDGGLTLSPDQLQDIGLEPGDEAVLVIGKRELVLMSPATALQKLSASEH